jgi:hypothetical protein
MRVSNLFRGFAPKVLTRWNKPLWPATLQDSIPSNGNTLEQKRAIAEQYFIDSVRGVPTHLDLQDSPAQLKEDLGKAFIRFKDAQGVSQIRYATEEEILDSNVIVIPGAGQDDRKGVSALGKAIEYFVNPVPEGYSCKPIIIHPLANRLTRTLEGYKYNMNKYHIAPYIKPLTEQYLLPRFLDSKTDTIKEPESEFCFFTFSTGAKDMAMMKNELVRILTEDYKLSEVDTATLIGYMRGVCVAAIPDFGGLSNIDHSKVLIFSVEDCGVKYPQTFKNLIELDPLLYECKHYTLFSFKEACPHPVHAIMLGTEVLPKYFEGKKDSNGHGLFHYVQAVKDLPTEVYIPLRDELLRKDYPSYEEDIIDVSGNNFEYYGC